MAFIIKPLVSEKSALLTDKENKYVFLVRPEANKVDIQVEIEKFYNVKVAAVNTMVYAGKNKSRYTKSGMIRGRGNRVKKAVVTLKEGESIDFYSNI